MTPHIKGTFHRAFVLSTLLSGFEFEEFGAYYEKTHSTDSEFLISEWLSRMISRRVWTVISDGTRILELMAENPESYCRTSKVAIRPHSPSVRHSHAQ